VFKCLHKIKEVSVEMIILCVVLLNNKISEVMEKAFLFMFESVCGSFHILYSTGQVKEDENQ
jgi:hypothetical protein